MITKRNDFAARRSGAPRPGPDPRGKVTETGERTPEKSNKIVIDFKNIL